VLSTVFTGRGFASLTAEGGRHGDKNGATRATHEPGATAPHVLFSCQRSGVASRSVPPRAKPARVGSPNPLGGAARFVRPRLKSAVYEADISSIAGLNVRVKQCRRYGTVTAPLSSADKSSIAQRQPDVNSLLSQCCQSDSTGVNPFLRTAAIRYGVLNGD
jgi:hypothetical protein